MRSKTLIVVMFCVLFALSNCRKSNEVPAENKPKVVLVDTSLFTGYWKLTSKPHNYYALYIKTDHNVKQDNTGVYSIDLEGSWSLISDSSANVGGQTAIIKKLNKDSLIFKVGQTNFRHVREQLPESDYTMTTIASDLDSPYGLTGDLAGNIYFGDAAGQRISMYSPVTKKIVTVAGSPLAMSLPPIIGYLNGITSIAMENEGNIIAFGASPQIARISLTDKKIIRLAGKGKGLGLENIPALESLIADPSEVKLDAKGNIYFCETQYNRIRKIDMSTGRINTIVSKINSTALPGMFPYISSWSIVFDKDGNLYISDIRNNVIWKYFIQAGNFELVAGNGKKGYSGDGGVATSAMLSGPAGLSIDANGNLVFADSGNSRIRKISAKSRIITTIAGRGVYGLDNWTNPLMAKLSRPFYTFIDVQGNIYLTDLGNSTIRKLTPKP